MADEALDIGTLRKGSLIANTYRLTELLGQGGMGVVWAAEHARLPGKKVAIKVLHAELGRNEELLARFKREAEIASKLGHPNIVEVHDLGALENGAPYIVLEYLNGISLRDHMEKGPMPVETVVPIVREICSALSIAHNNDIIHRDLKPENIFMVSLGGEQQGLHSAKVLDFGISKIKGSTTVLTQESTMLGTPQYMAPEQAAGKHDEIDGRTDLFALGAMVYEMIKGAPAFGGQSIPEVVFKVVYEDPEPLKTSRPDVSDAINTSLLRALSKNRDERYASVDEFIEAFSGVPLGATGNRPLISMSSPTPIPEGQQVKQHSPESMAQTMAGDDAMAVSVAQLPASVVTPIQPDSKANTIPEPEKNFAKPKSKLPWIIGGVVACLALGGGVALLGRGKSDAVAHDQGERQFQIKKKDGESETPVIEPEIKKTPKPETQDSPQSGTSTSVTKTPQTKNTGKTSNHSPKSGKEKNGLNKEQQSLLNQANNALSARQLDKARKLARELKKASAVSSQKLILGKIACLERDLGQANTYKRGLTGAKKSALRSYCKKKGMTLAK